MASSPTKASSSTMASLWGAKKTSMIIVLTALFVVALAQAPVPAPIGYFVFPFGMVVLVGISVFAILQYRKRFIEDKRHRTEFLTLTMEKFLNDLERESPTMFTSDNLVRATNNYSDMLGSGGFGSVYKGTFSDGTVVAVKVLHGTFGERMEQQFMAEVSTIGKVRHLNLVCLIGFCIEKNTAALVYEYMSNGSLDKYLFSENKDLALEMLQQIAVETAKGIAYLHEEYQERIIHYDIKPENILLDDNLHCKIADFGLAMLSNREKSYVTMTRPRGTPGYAAPELWMPFPVTHKCDIYSFGIMLFEIIGRRRHYDASLPSIQQWLPRWIWIKFENKNLDELMITECRIEDKGNEKVKRMIRIALWCIQYKPDLRPKMSDVVKMLEGSMDVPEPSNPFQQLSEENHVIEASQMDSSSDDDGCG